MGEPFTDELPTGIMVPDGETNPFMLDISPHDWKVSQVVVLDWYDGPRSGFARLKFPVVEIHFELLAERPTPNGLDDRLFAINILPEGTLAALLSALRFAGAPATPVWAPRWESSDKSELECANRAVADAKNSAVTTMLVIRSSDFIEFQGCWDIKFTPADGVGDWFTHLKI